MTEASDQNQVLPSSSHAQYQFRGLHSLPFEPEPTISPDMWILGRAFGLGMTVAPQCRSIGPH